MPIRHPQLSRRASVKAHISLVRLEKRCMPHQSGMPHVHDGHDDDGGLDELPAISSADISHSHSDGDEDTEAAPALL